LVQIKLATLVGLAAAGMWRPRFGAIERSPKPSFIQIGKSPIKINGTTEPILTRPALINVNSLLPIVDHEFSQEVGS